ncbi:SDR family NAD(P)-dependent oxidoreductase [Arthrobacter sp. UYCu723]
MAHNQIVLDPFEWAVPGGWSRLNGAGLRKSALALADAGTDVVITYRSNHEEAAAVVTEITARGRRAVALKPDTTQYDTFPAFAIELATALTDTWDRNSFDYLVNNAASPHSLWSARRQSTTSPKNLVHAVSPSTRSHPARSPPTSAAASSATTRTSIPT